PSYAPATPWAFRCSFDLRGLRRRTADHRRSSPCLRLQPQHRPSDPCREQRTTFAPECLEEFDQRVGGRPSARAKAKVVLGAAEPRAAEMSVRVREAAL